MSLLNQVLRDLDKRQSAGAPAAVTTSPRPAAPGLGQRAGRWMLGAALTLVAVVAGGFAQGSLSWPARAATVAAPVLPAPVAAAPVLPTSDMPPAALAAAPVATPVALTPAQPVRVPVTPAVATAVAPPVLPVAPAPAEPQPAPVVTALAPPSTRPADLPQAAAAPKARTPKPEAEGATAVPSPAGHIDKRNATRTPRERAEAQYQRGVAAHQAGLIDESGAAFSAALREDPDFHPARQAQAGVLIGQSRGDEAMVLLQEGLALAPQQPVLSLMLARLQADRQQLDAALATLQAAATQAAQNAEYLGVYAAILQRAGRHADASEKYGQALRLAPAHGVWWMGLGISLVADGQGDAAREAFLRAKATGSLPTEAGLYVDARLRQLL